MEKQSLIKSFQKTVIYKEFLSDSRDPALFEEYDNYINK